MNCPVCNINLHITERQNIEIDYCPQCRGVWLDRGELDKIIERSQEPAAGSAPAAGARGPVDVQQPMYPPAAPAPQERPRYKERYHDDDDDDRYKYKRDSDYKKRKKRGFLGELFDFD